MSAIDIIEQFKNLLQEIDKLTLHIQKDLTTAPIWVNDPKQPDQFVPDYNLFIKALVDFYPGGLETPQHTKSFQGAIGGTLKTLALIKHVNDSKDKLKSVINEYLKEIKQRDTPIIHTILKNAGFPRLKLKQVYRHIPYIDYHPRRITFTQVKHNSHKIVTKEELAKK